MKKNLFVLFFVLMIPVKAQTVSFSSGEGYSSGALSGQNSWTAASGTGGTAIVDSSAGTVALGGTGTSNITLTAPSSFSVGASTTYTSSIDFKFTTGGADALQATFMQLCIGVSTADCFRVNLLRKTTTGDYFIQVSDFTGATLSSNATSVTAANTGFAGGNVAGTSIDLRVKLTLVSDATGTTWTPTAELFKVSDGSLLSTRSLAAGQDASSAFNSSQLKTFLVFTQGASTGTFVTDATVSDFSFSAVPEPSTYAFVLGSLLVLIPLMRKRLRDV